MYTGYILYQRSKVVNQKNLVEYYGRLRSGESFKIVLDDTKPYFYIREKDRKKAVGLFRNADFEKTSFKNFDGEKVVKAIFKNSIELKIGRDLFVDNQISVFEADILTPQRILMDLEILRTFKTDSKPVKGDFVDLIFTNPEIEPIDEFYPNLKVLSIDIETSKDAKKLYSISLVLKDYKNVIIVAEEKLKNAISVSSEKEALILFKQKIKELDPDVIVGWNVIDFDFNVLRRMYKKHGVEFNLGRSSEEVSIRVERDYFRDSNADFNGRVVLDGIHLLKSSFVSLDDYKLSTAAHELLGEKKIIGDENKGLEIEEAYANNKQKLVDYNLKDSELVLGILDKTGVMGITISRSFLTGLPLERVKASIASLDSLYLRALREKGVVAVTTPFASKEERITGGYVQASQPGIYDYVLVLDFKSLYPSIIRTFNIDPYSHTTKKTGSVVEAPNGALFRNEEGILPGIIQRLWQERDKAKKENNDLKSYAIKILMNSFFGVLANPTCRFFSTEVANAITHFGQFLIKKTSELISKKGYEVIYGDTDSVFVNADAKNYAQAKKIGDTISSYINDYFTKIIKKNYSRENMLEIEFDKVFKKFFMPKVRGGEQGSKKRYAGLREKSDGSTKLEFTGLEFVRRDWTEVSKHFQLGLLDLVFKEKPVESFIQGFVKDVKKGSYDNDLIYKKALRKNLDEYVKTTPPHVKAARLLDKIDSTIISYVMTVDGPQPTQKTTSNIDYNHYIEKQIKPIADSVLVFFDKKFDDLIQGESQKNLFNY